MRLVKLDAIHSTNDFLKEMAVNQEVEDFTVVTAERQTAGRGQMGAKWHTQDGKNLIMSVFIKKPVNAIDELFVWNAVVAVSVAGALRALEAPVSIKWPNDIMSGNKKIGGILIENTIRASAINSIIGIGLNVNQTDFPGLPNASSLKAVLEKEINRDLLRDKIVDALKLNIIEMQANPKAIWQAYKSNLFRKDLPTAFEDSKGQKFMGIIRDVSNDGRLMVADENEAIKLFGIKEIKMLY